MKSEWIDYPVSVIIAATRTTVGAILLFILACGFGHLAFWMTQPEVLSPSNYTGRWYYVEDALASWPISVALGVLGLWGLPSLAIQIVCFHHLIWTEKSRLHLFFAVAAAQTLLAFLFHGFVLGWVWDTAVTLALACIALGLPYGILIFTNRSLCRTANSEWRRKTERRRAW